MGLIFFFSLLFGIPLFFWGTANTHQGGLRQGWGPFKIPEKLGTKIGVFLQKQKWKGWPGSFPPLSSREAFLSATCKRLPSWR